MKWHRGLVRCGEHVRSYLGKGGQDVWHLVADCECDGAGLGSLPHKADLAAVCDLNTCDWGVTAAGGRALTAVSVRRGWGAR